VSAINSGHPFCIVSDLNKLSLMSTVHKLEEVFSEETYQLTGVAVSKSGRIFTNFPYWSDIYKYAVVETGLTHHLKPFPDAEWNNWKVGKTGDDHWVCVQAIVIDDQDMMWVVDPASPKQKGVYAESQKLVKINLSTDKVEKIYPLRGVMDNQSYANDVRIDTKKQIAYLTNSSSGGIIVVDLKTGNLRQVLQGHISTISDPGYTLKIDGQIVKKGKALLKFNSDGIALNPEGDYLYYKPLTDDRLFRISTEALNDLELSALELGEKVEFLGNFTTTDGMAFDSLGNLYIGDLEQHRIMKISPDLEMTELLKDERLIWPDSYQIADNFLYVSCSQIDKQADSNDGIDRRSSPYKIFKINI